ncbi:adenylate kinase family protein [Mycoplasma crocodyli]|uniref:Adenylate kinase n=1 Tax=Mycoplasma crocodyli (strain ATCC 51981 / MP145) TaxID=512564 RepID=D5E4X8_MYCCM|nr:nucleoside monophosphate kinase [Mycoplasma crocodyli]ADE19930.1 adenylate kinase [Mycoplasma crocodyli MP145]
MIKVRENIIFMGPPGAGKGTVAEVLSKTTDLVHISTGNIFREEIAKQTPLGLKIKELVESGSYVTDEITNEIVKNKVLELHKKNKFMILDGYPRTLEQARFLDKIKEVKFKVVQLVANEDIIIERLTGRRFCSKCNSTYHIPYRPSKQGDLCEKCLIPLSIRKDDAPEAIKVRLITYVNQTKPLLDYYAKTKRMVEVDSLRAPEVIAQDILDLLQK